MYPPLFQGMSPLVVPQGQDCSSPYKLTDKAKSVGSAGDGVSFFYVAFFSKNGHALFQVKPLYQALPLINGGF